MCFSEGVGHRYINGLADAIVKKGGKSYEETRVMKCEGTKVTTEEAFQVTANALVIATNSPINHDLLIHA